MDIILKVFLLVRQVWKAKPAKRKHLAKLSPSCSGSKLQLPAERSATFDLAAKCYCSAA